MLVNFSVQGCVLIDLGLDFFLIVSPLDQIPVRFPCSMKGVAVLVVGVLMHVYGLGIKICNQVFPFDGYFSIQEHYGQQWNQETPEYLSTLWSKAFQFPPAYPPYQATGNKLHGFLLGPRFTIIGTKGKGPLSLNALPGGSEGIYNVATHTY